MSISEWLKTSGSYSYYQSPELMLQWSAKIFFLAHGRGRHRDEGRISCKIPLLRVWPWHHCHDNLTGNGANDGKWVYYLYLGVRQVVWNSQLVIWLNTSWTCQNPETNCWAYFESRCMRAISHHPSSPFAWLGQQWPRPARATSHRSSAVLAGVTQVRKSSLFHPYVSSSQIENDLSLSTLN